jgi:predicted nucleic acid-binding protein
MILVDTSVWIEFFRQNMSYVKDMELLLKGRFVVTVEPVFSELLFGVRHKKHRELIMSYWNILPRIAFGAGSMLEASRFANKNGYYQAGIGLMDAIIVKSAMDGNHSIWTFDKKINGRIDKKFIYSQT